MSAPHDPTDVSTRQQDSLRTGSFDLPPPPEWDAPEELGGYRLLGPIGRGGMGVVFRAEDPRVGRLVAVKVMSPAAAARPGLRERFLREAQAQGAVEHDNVVPVYAADQQGGVAYIVMPLLRGRTLAARLRDGPLPPAEAVRIAREAAEGIAAAHRAGLIHRDIKPGNLWLDETGRVRLMDFGLACEVADPGEAAVTGTPCYMAPEQADGAAVDGRADLFGLGCVLYEMLTGRRPFRGTTMAEILEEVRRAEPPAPRGVSPRLAGLVRSLMAKDPADRPAGAREAADALRALEARPSRRWLAAALVALIAAPLAYLALAPRKKEEPAPPPPPPPKKGFPPLDAAWAAKVAGMTREEQKEAVRAEVMRRNPGFDGKMEAYPFNGGRSVKYLMNSYKLKDLTPFAAVPGLADLECYGNFAHPGDLESLEPIRGLKLWQAGFSHNPVRDLSPLADSEAHVLYLSQIDAEDFTPVYGLPLEVLHLTSRRGTRLDASRLVGKELRDVWLAPTAVDDFALLKGIPTLKEVNSKPAARFWQEYEKGMR